MSLFLMIAAQAAAPAAEVAAPAAQAPTPAAERGVIAYPPSFFAEAAPTSAYDMVIRLPGFAFEAGQAVRGLAGASGNVLIDGQPPVSKNDRLDEALKRIPAAAVERVELIRGGAPGIDMEGRTVLANVVRKQTAGFRAAVMPATNLVSDGRALNGIRAEAQWQWPGGRSAELSQVYGKGPNEELGDGERRLYRNGAVRISDVDADAQGLRVWTTGAFETPLLGGRARINGAYMRTPGSTEIYDRIRGGGLEYEYQNAGRIQAELGGRFSRPLTPTLSLEAVGFQQWNGNDVFARFEAPALTRDFRLDRDSTETVGRLNLRWRQSPAVVVDFGGEAALNQLESQTRLAVNGAQIALPAGDVEVEERRGEVFARASWRLSPALTLEGGLRQEASTITSVILRGVGVSSDKSLQFTKPRAGLTWAPNAANQVRLRFEREVGQLNFDDFVASPNVVSTGAALVGNPEITPAQSWVAEATYERRFWGDAAAVLTLRHMAISDVVDRVPVFARVGGVLTVVADAPGNIGEGTRDELQASLTLPLARFGVSAAQLKSQLTVRRSAVDDPLTGESREISGLQPLNWEVRFSQDLPQWRTTWGVDVLGAFRERFFRFNEVETRKLSTYVLVYAEYKPRPDWILRVEAQGVNQRNAKRIREVYRGARNQAPLDLVDVRDLEWGGSLLIRLRKTFS